MKIDNLDLEIIKHLQNDARLSFRELGRKLNIPHTTIFTRAERLVKRGIIKRFSAILHPHELGLKISMLFIHSNPSESKRVAKEIAEHPEIRKVFRTIDGKIIAKAVVPNHGHGGLEDFLAKLDGYQFDVYPIHEVTKFESDIPSDILKTVDFYRDRK